jgi:sugar-specific transcriptional regulator TrmB
MKALSVEYYKQHKIKCEAEQEFINKNKLYDSLKEKNILLEKQNRKLKSDISDIKKQFGKLNQDLDESRNKYNQLKNISISQESEIEKLKTIITFLEKQNDKFHTSSTSITMKLAEKVNTVNNNTVVINTNQVTNDVLRQCATTFTIDNAYNINGITKHFTNSLEDHITCTDPSRNIFKYTNEKDEEIVDHNLEILFPQYLKVVKDRNNFLYKEVFEYFEKNNVPLDIKTDYQVFYNALNNIIEKNGQQNKYT